MLQYVEHLWLQLFLVFQYVEHFTTSIVVLQHVEHYDHINYRIAICGFLEKKLAPKYEWVVEWMIKRPKFLSSLADNPY